MRFLTWNIRHGGGDPDRLATAIADLAPAIVVVTEFRAGRKGLALVSALSAAGFTHVSFDPDVDTNGVLVASRHALHPGSEAGLSGHSHRWRHVEVPQLDLEVLGLYVPPATAALVSRNEKQRFWDELLDAASRLQGRRAMITGDFNTGAHTVDEEGSTFTCADNFVQLSESGWVDAFRALNGSRREYSWWSATRGFRLDHAFLSPTLAEHLRAVGYVTRTPGAVLAHPVPKRQQIGLPKSLSDHAAMVLDLADR